MIGNEQHILTQSSLKKFLACHRKYKFRYIDKLVKKGPKEQPLYFGGAIHDGLKEFHETRQYEPAMDAIKQAIEEAKEDGNKFDLISFLKAEAMLKGYGRQYITEEFEVVELEKEFIGDVVAPGGGAIPGFRFAGKVDGIIKEDDQYYLLEHKTASNLQPGYSDKLWTDLQILLYSIYIEQAMGVTLSGVLYNVLVKTGIKWKDNETLEEYKSRLFVTYSKPEMFFRKYIEFNEADYVRVKKDLVDITRDIQRCMMSNRWYRNTQSCYQWNRPCAYFKLCKLNELSSIKTQDYEVREPHEELEGVKKLVQESQQGRNQGAFSTNRPFG